MKLSFVIPAYNEEDHIKACLLSIAEQTKGSPDFEIIVVNNASHDRTKEIALSVPGVKVVDEPKKGLTRARKAGYLAARADLVANIDADTMLTPRWLDKVVQSFESNKNLVALSGPFIYYDLPVITGFFVRFFYYLGTFWGAIFHYFFDFGAMLQGGNFIIKKSAFDQVGGFNEDIEFYGEDTDVARRISQAGEVVFSYRLPIYASGRRLSQEGVIVTGIKYAVNFIWMIVFKRPFSGRHRDIRAKV